MEYPNTFVHMAKESAPICSPRHIWDRDAVVDELPEKVFCAFPMSVDVNVIFRSRESRTFSMEPTDTIADLRAIIRQDFRKSGFSIMDRNRQLDPRDMICSVLFGAADKVLRIDEGKRVLLLSLEMAALTFSIERDWALTELQEWIAERFGLTTADVRQHRTFPELDPFQGVACPLQDPLELGAHFLGHQRVHIRLAAADDSVQLGPVVVDVTGTVADLLALLPRRSGSYHFWDGEYEIWKHPTAPLFAEILPMGDVTFTITDPDPPEV
jgi:hypothetical protein